MSLRTWLFWLELSLSKGQVENSFLYYWFWFSFKKQQSILVFHFSKYFWKTEIIALTLLSFPLTEISEYQMLLVPFFFFFIPPLPTFWIFVSNILVLLCRNYFFLSLKTFILLPQLNHLFRFCLNKSNFQYAHISHFLN